MCYTAQPPMPRHVQDNPNGACHTPVTHRSSIEASLPALRGPPVQDIFKSTYCKHGMRPRVLSKHETGCDHSSFCRTLQAFQHLITIERQKRSHGTEFAASPATTQLTTAPETICNICGDCLLVARGRGYFDRLHGPCFSPCSYRPHDPGLSRVS